MVSRHNMSRQLLNYVFTVLQVLAGVMLLLIFRFSDSPLLKGENRGDATLLTLLFLGAVTWLRVRNQKKLASTDES